MQSVDGRSGLGGFARSTDAAGLYAAAMFAEYSRGHKTSTLDELIDLGDAANARSTIRQWTS
jgi:hypothetical protein